MSSQIPSLLLGTRNAGKVREIETILGDVPWQLCLLTDFANVGIAAETAPSYVENAIAKARFYARETGLRALADDSGLEVDALGGAPGVLSARYAGDGASDAQRRALLLSELAQQSSENRSGSFHERAGFEGSSGSERRARSERSADSDRSSGSDRTARFVCAVAVALPDGAVLNTCEGVCEGRIIFEERGTNGFGYDPLFVPDGFDETFAELSDVVKNRISHRARALLKTREFLLSHRTLLDPSTPAS